MPVLPDYQGRSLAGVMTSVAAHLAPAAGFTDVFGLPQARHYVVLLVDGLGWHNLAASLAHAPYLAGIFGDGIRVTSSAPSTTGTAIPSLTTGVAPGLHGLVGYRFRPTPDAKGMNALSWEGGPDSLDAFRLAPTVFSRLADWGVRVNDVSLTRFAQTPLTRIAFDGATFVPVENENDASGRVSQAVDVVCSGGPSLTYIYERGLDHTGHPRGWRSQSWTTKLSLIDDAIERFVTQTTGEDVCLLITGDHGMVDVPETHKLFVEDDSRLGSDVELLEGEARFRHIYTDRASDVVKRWAKVLGERAWVYRREEAIEMGLFGAYVSPAVRERLGDCLVAMRDDWAVVTHVWPGEAKLIGMHGSLTPEEMYVPLLIEHETRDDEGNRG
ncbi:MAG: alkaline phosphatase family protein [Propionibacteriaceae bacterium]|nr:alkaline phosphatase family protein [Propionibacteriaceae bacterium]